MNKSRNLRHLSFITCRKIKSGHSYSAISFQIFASETLAFDFTYDISVGINVGNRPLPMPGVARKSICVDLGIVFCVGA